MIKKNYRFTLLALFIILPIAGAYFTLERNQEEAEEEPMGISLGCFEGDCVNGLGSTSYSPSDLYSGEFKNGKHNGLGFYRDTADGGLYFGAGTYKDNIPIDITWWKSLEFAGINYGNYGIDLTHFASGDSIQIVGDYIHSVELLSDVYNTKTSKTTKYEIDCKTNRFREIESYSYSNSMGTGEATQLEPDNTWEKIDTVTKYDEHLLHSDICKAYSRAIENNETEIDITYMPLSFQESKWMDTKYQETMGIVFDSSSVTDEDVWSFNDSTILPSCLEIDWYSNDNYEEYVDQFSEISNYEHFSSNPGLYFGKPISTEPISWSWCESDPCDESEKIKISKTFPQCIDIKDDAEITEDGRDLTYSGDEGRHGYKSYNLIRKVPLDVCNKLAPHFNGECKDAFFLKVEENFGGSGVWQYHYIYGLFEEEKNSQPSYEILPLKRFDSRNIGLDYLDSLMELD